MAPNSDSWLPHSKDFEQWLELTENTSIQDLIDQTLLSPLQEFLSRPSKNFRSSLVELSYQLVGQEEVSADTLLEAMRILEAIHAASLVVDDIQDNSELRRGKLTLHRTHGMPVALNSANWLYFWPLEKIHHLKLSQEKQVRILRACHKALIKAHSGQALDVGVSMCQVPQSRVRDICLASLELKTGALTALAMEVGAILAGAQAIEEQQISRFGSDFGVALQMFDDLGNVSQIKGEDPKRFEDLRGQRPSWIWASAANQLSNSDYEKFVTVVRCLPDEAPLTEYLKSADWLKNAKKEGQLFLEGSLNRFLQQPWKSEAIHGLNRLAEKLKGAYE